MFKNLTNFSYKRTGKEALGFYLAYLVLGQIISILFGLFAVLVILMFNPNALASPQARSMGIAGGAAFSCIFYMILCILILKQKKLFGNFSYLLLLALTGFLSLLFGGFLGLIPVAILSTKDAKI